MAFENFKPIPWATKFNEDLKEALVGYEDCSHEYEGIARQVGDAVKILGIGRPTVYHESNGKLHKLSDPDTPQTNTQLLEIKQSDVFNFGVEDLDKAQAQGGSSLISRYSDGARFKVQSNIDAYIFSLASSKMINLDEDSEDYGKFTIAHEANCDTVDDTSAALKKDTICDAIDELLVKLLDNKIARAQEIVLTLPPRAVMLLKQNYVLTDTDNSAMLKNGKVGMYNGITIKESVNTCRYDEGGSAIHECQIRTKNAVAFVKPYTHMEAYRVEKDFMDAIKGYTVYDGMIVRPKEIVNWKFKLA